MCLSVYPFWVQSCPFWELLSIPFSVAFVRSLSAHVLLCLVALVALVTSAYCQTDETMAGMQMGETRMDIAHPFFTHMGMPEGVGNYALRLAGVATRDDGDTDGDFGIHLETGLSKTIGLHIRNQMVLTEPHTEVTFQFAAVSSGDGMSSFAPFMELEIPTLQRWEVSRAESASIFSSDWHTRCPHRTRVDSITRFSWRPTWNGDPGRKR